MDHQNTNGITVTIKTMVRNRADNVVVTVVVVVDDDGG